MKIEYVDASWHGGQTAGKIKVSITVPADEINTVFKGVSVEQFGERLARALDLEFLGAHEIKPTKRLLFLE